MENLEIQFIYKKDKPETETCDESQEMLNWFNGFDLTSLAFYRVSSSGYPFCNHDNDDNKEVLSK